MADPAPLPALRPVRPGINRLVSAFSESGLETPSFVLDESQFHHNGRILQQVQERTGCKILLAQKAFSSWCVYPVLRQYLVGTAASGLYEARLGREEFGGEVHVFCPAFKPAEMDSLVGIADHLIFNSLHQWQSFREQVRKSTSPVSPGLRINPEYSSSPAELYDPCACGSRFGILARQLEGADLEGIEGLHFHTLCEQNSDALESTLEQVYAKFDHWLKHMRWLNFGGGHLITAPHYDVERLIRCIQETQRRYPHLQIYLEPGEAVAWDAGVLIGTVIDLVENGMEIAVLDLSATAHMPDVLEMPYRPAILGGGEPGEKAHTYRLGGPTCLSGDVIGDYSFDKPLQRGNRLVFLDMAYYTIVKTTMFNGVPHPSLTLVEESGAVRIVREYTYEDYRNRMGA
ncbi:MAG: carboxynorspermidine decarboxylase [Verrucomicrobiales bacterium]|nr:carboxynorspermidine decarboxylase [Verrucomicrobiales bacterium]